MTISDDFFQNLRNNKITEPRFRRAITVMTGFAAGLANDPRATDLQGSVAADWNNGYDVAGFFVAQSSFTPHDPAEFPA